MKAIVIDKAGGPEVLGLKELEDPSPESDELLVQVEAAGLNFLDTYHRTALYPVDFPLIPGVEGAGTVLELGSRVEGFSVGDRVGWSGAMGTYAEQLAVPADKAVLVPDGIDTKMAAAVLLQGTTAHYLASDTFPLADGDICLVHAGAGGVGLLLTQIAKQKGARVITTVGTDRKAELSRQAGADDVIVYTAVDFAQAVTELVGPNAVDVVYDGVGAATFARGLDILRPRGMMVTFGNASGPPPDVPPLLLSRKGSLYLTRPSLGDYTGTPEALTGRAQDLFGWIESGDLVVSIGDEYPLERAADAHRALEGRETTGKVLLIP